ncbi:hypothetical protein HYQ45_015679 [Verticillium longisporum]|uniref:Uncharacterized protein n=1 Tax=Verticillium longisporum TaxID=100787 RepID=A0A8I2Z5Y4_VERLO|nr:hypothetical protein HYQ45_015679 [Verticillium longisporum]
MGKRLRSTWGPHWRCEAAPSNDDLGVRKLLLVCKHMYSEAIEYMVHRLVFHVTDLNTLDALCKTQHTAEGPSKTTSLSSIGHGMQIQRKCKKWLFNGRKRGRPSLRLKASKRSELN